MRQFIAGGLSVVAGASALGASIVSLGGAAGAAEARDRTEVPGCAKPAGSHRRRPPHSQKCVDHADDHSVGDGGEAKTGGRGATTTTVAPTTTTMAPTTTAPTTTTTAPTTTTTAPPPTTQEISQATAIPPASSSGPTAAVRVLTCPTGLIATNGTAASQTTLVKGETVPSVTATAADATLQGWTYQFSNPNPRVWSFLLKVTCS